MREVLRRDKIRVHMQNQFGLSDQQIDSMLPSFMETLAGYLNELAVQFAAGDQQEAGRVAHTIKGALLNLGLHEQASLAKDIELRAKAGIELVDLESDFKKLRAALGPLLD